MNPADHLHLNILENMRDGVMALDFKGRITLFNPAASEILGLTGDLVRGMTFAEIFIASEENNDDFNQVVLDAVLQNTGEGRRETVDFTRPDGATVTLTVTSSYLRDETDEQARGVIVVFSDVTKLQHLQEQEKEQSRRLAEAFGNLEEANTRLTQVLKRVQVVRIVATLGIILFFVGLGLYQFFGISGLKFAAGDAAPAPQTAEAGKPTYKITPGPLRSSISLSGRLQPIEEIVIAAPFDATIMENHFIFGQRVSEGDLLMRLDVSELKVKLRETESAHIKALQNYRELVDWNEGMEMARARRALQRAESRLAADRRKLEESGLLFSKGLISGNELDMARQQVESSSGDVVSGTEDLEATRRKGASENVAIARMELENIQIRLEDLKETLEKAEIRAVVSGVVIRPSVEDDKKVALDRGARVQPGTSLLALGDLEGLRVMARVDEIDIGRLAVGQPVTARGDAFPGIVLAGAVAHISAQATGGSAQQPPGFDVQITIPELSRAARDIIRIGMSADLEILVRDNPDALLVPLPLVRSVRGRSMVRLLDDEGRIEEREVQTGITTLTSVELISGVQAGDYLAEW